MIEDDSRRGHRHRIHRVGGTGVRTVANRYFPGMQGRRGWGRGVSGVLLAGVLVAGCTGEATPAEPSRSEPAASPTASTSPTPTGTPTTDLSTPPVRPEAMATPSAEGAAAAASYFVSALYVHMYEAQDVTAWAEIAGEDCAFCSSVIRDVETMVSSGLTEAGTRVVVESASGTEVIPGESYTATLVAEQSPTTRRDGEGNVVSRGSGGRYELLVALGWNGGWVVRAVDVHELGPA
ncbi:DUF6318 family protein [Cellulomonas telluris]|uniref:DUF6318 family protein n=1 Tax=Cellulomonas telluris TaxID=2306636 RepID=UPI0010A8B08D|nr:DUF6318 family protein [Cellulomonas telluris]